MQEDKEPLFAAHDQAVAILEIAAGATAASRFHHARLRQAAADPALVSTEAADYLVRRGVPFRQAHEIVGKIVREAERAGGSWAALPLEQLKKFSPLFAALTPEAALAARAVFGGTSPARVREAVAAAKKRLDAFEASA